MVIYRDRDEETDSRLLNLTAHSVDVTLGQPCSESPPDARFNWARQFPRNSHLRLWSCASKRSTGCSHRSQRCKKGVRLCQCILDTSVGGEPSPKTWPAPRPHLDKPFATLPRFERTRAQSVRSPGRKYALENYRCQMESTRAVGSQRSLMCFDGTAAFHEPAFLTFFVGGRQSRMNAPR